MLAISKREGLLILTPTLVLVGLLAMQLCPSPHENALRSQCSGRLAELGRAFAIYAQDNNGFFPPITSGASRTDQGVTLPPYKGWADVLSAQCKIPFNMFVCYGDKHPSPNAGFAPKKSGVSDYWMNRRLSSQSKRQLTSPASTLLLGEGNDGRDISNATYSKMSLPPTWLKDANGPAVRHLGGANYLMADGTVHWLRPKEVTTFGNKKDAFALR